MGRYFKTLGALATTNAPTTTRPKPQVDARGCKKGERWDTIENICIAPPPVRSGPVRKARFQTVSVQVARQQSQPARVAPASGRSWPPKSATTPPRSSTPASDRLRLLKEAKARDEARRAADAATDAAARSAAEAAARLAEQPASSSSSGGSSSGGGASFNFDESFDLPEDDLPGDGGGSAEPAKKASSSNTLLILGGAALLAILVLK